jgi:hypothetical protein
MKKAKETAKRLAISRKERCTGQEKWKRTGDETTTRADRGGIRREGQALTELDNAEPICRPRWAKKKTQTALRIRLRIRLKTSNACGPCSERSW